MVTLEQYEEALKIINEWKSQEKKINAFINRNKKEVFFDDMLYTITIDGKEVRKFVSQTEYFALLQDILTYEQYERYIQNDTERVFLIDTEIINSFLKS